MGLLVVTFVFTSTFLSVPTEAYYCLLLSNCVPPLEPLDYNAILTLPPAPENNAGQKTAAATARDVTSVPVDPVARPFYGKRSAQVYQGLLQEKDHLFGKRSAAVPLVVFDGSNADHFVGKREAPRYPYMRQAPRYPYKREAPGYLGKREAPRSAAESLEVDESNTDHFWGKREAPRYPYKREAPRYPYKRSATESEVGESNADHIIIGKREAPGYLGKRSVRHLPGKRSVPADVQQEEHNSVFGKRAAPTSMEAE
jgi:hypothetical protein